MASWILIIAIGGVVSMSDVKTVPMTEQQCRAAVQELYPLRKAIGAACVGPEGQTFNFSDL